MSRGLPSITVAGLDAYTVAALLVSVHYGIGFLLGAGEKAFTQGAAGSLYAVSTGLGVLGIMVLARLYWREKFPIWTLLGTKYGVRARTLAGLMSWTWMIGVVAAQVVGGASVLKLIGIPVLPGMLALASLLLLISILPVERAGRLFQALLLLNSIILIYSLVAAGGSNWYFQTLSDFVPTLTLLDPGTLLGIPITTILLTMIGMDFHQFVVRAKDVRNAQQGCILASIVLICLAFLPSSVVVAAKQQGVLSNLTDGREAIPSVVVWAGGGAGTTIGGLFLVCLLVALLGSGGGVLRVMNQTIFDFDILAATGRNQLLTAIITTLLALAVALTGEAIIDLIVSFYAIYVASVFPPFVAYILERARRSTFSAKTMHVSLVIGSISSITTLIITRMAPSARLLGSAELSILLVGLFSSTASLLVGKLADPGVRPSKG